MKNKSDKTNNIQKCADDDASSACIVSWQKQCNCKGYSNMPGWTNKSKLTGDKYSVSIGLIQEPVCEKCRKPWKLVFI